MPDNRCGALILGCTVFIGFTFLSDVFWGSSAGGSNTASGFEMEGSRLFRGSFQMGKNGSVALDGDLRITMASRTTSANGIRIVEISFGFYAGRKLQAFAPQEVVLQGLDLRYLGALSLSGMSEPSHSSLFGTTTCSLKALIDFQDENRENKQGPGVIGEKGVTGEMLSQDCGVEIHFNGNEVDMKHLSKKVVHYSIWVNLLTLVQMRCYIAQMRYTEEGPSAIKVSIVCFGWQAMMDAYDAFLHLCLGLSSQYMFNTFAVVSLFKFVQFSFLGMRYLLTLWKSRRREAFAQGWEAVRREVSWLYSRFYSLLLLGLVLLYNSLHHLHIIALCAQAFWLPQIVRDARKGTRNALHPTFLLGISLTRCLLPMYLWGCPESVFSGDAFPRLPAAPSAFLCTAVVAVQAGQVALMLSQQALGPRWFVPWACLPGVYNYYRPTIGTDAEGGALDCVICMCELAPEESAQHVVTPCDHHFHRACLDQWMDVKMECPTCRMELPPIQ